MKLLLSIILSLCLFPIANIEAVEIKAEQEEMVTAVPTVSPAMDKAIEAYLQIVSEHSFYPITLDENFDIDRVGTPKDEVIMSLDNNWDDMAEVLDGNGVSVLYMSDEVNPLSGHKDEAQLLLSFNRGQLSAVSIANRISSIEYESILDGKDLSGIASNEATIEDIIAEQPTMVGLMHFSFEGEETLATAFLNGEGASIFQLEMFIFQDDEVYRHGTLPASYTLNYVQNTLFDSIVSVATEQIDNTNISHPFDVIINEDSFPGVNFSGEDVVLSQSMLTAWEKYKKIIDQVDFANESPDSISLSILQFLMLFEAPGIPVITPLNERQHSLNYVIIDDMLNQADLQLVFDYNQLVYVGIANLAYSYTPDEMNTFTHQDFQAISLGSTIEDLAMLNPPIQTIAQTYNEGELYYQLIIPYQLGRETIAAILTLNNGEIVHVDEMDFTTALIHFQLTMQEGFSNYFSTLNQ